MEKLKRCIQDTLLRLYGIKKNADLNNLSESDFLILDPWGPKKRSGTQNCIPRKINMTRILLRGDHNSGHYKDPPKTPGYFLCIYTDPKKYTKSNISIASSIYDLKESTEPNGLKETKGL